MRKLFLFLAMAAGCMMMQAGIAEYEFTGVRWQSKQGTTVCDSTTNGWQCHKAGAALSTSYQLGVQVTSKEAYTGAGATSALSFNKVRRIRLNYATTTKGKGSIRIQVGDNEPIDSVITTGTTNHDLDIILPDEQSGQVTFWVNCTTNSIYLHSIAIRSADGVSPDFNEKTYRLVSSENQLQEGDQIIIGIADGNTRQVMGYFDESVSQNNIHPIPAVYDEERYTVREDLRAVYTLHKWEEDGRNYYVIEDTLRYYQVFLVASGGRTKNRLAVWDDYTSDAYGDYGIWTIDIADNGAATICSQGTSLGRYIQYNAGAQLFACYQQPDQYTPVCIYRATEAIGTDHPAISAPLVNMGDVLLQEGEAKGEKQVKVNAILLQEDIQVSLTGGQVFSLGASTLDRDGDLLTIRYHATLPGSYADTLVLRSGEVEVRTPVLMHVYGQMEVSEAVQQPDYSMVYMQPLVVTKKWDKYIFVRDESGSMLIYDNVGADGKPFGQGLKRGDVLRGVHGRMLNYYGVPELQPLDGWTTSAAVECLPDSGMATLDSADVCRYVVLDSVVLTDDAHLRYNGQQYAYTDKFNLGNLSQGVACRLEAVVSIDWDVLTLWVVSQQLYPALPDALDNTQQDEPTRKVLRDGHLFIESNGRRYSLPGSAAE